MTDIYNSLPGYLRDKNIDIDQFMKIVGVNEEAIERYMRGKKMSLNDKTRINCGIKVLSKYKLSSPHWVPDILNDDNYIHYYYTHRVEFNKEVQEFMEKFDRLYSKELSLPLNENNWGNNYYKKHKFDKNCECDTCKYFCRCMKTVENPARYPNGSCEQKRIFDRKERGYKV